MTSAQKRRIWFENFRQAFQTLAAHKFRSFLTVLGVLVGIITVVLVASILTGMRKQILLMVEEFGTNNVFAFHLNMGMQMGRRPKKELMRKPLKPEYARVITDRCPAVKDVAYSLFPRKVDLKVKYQGEIFREAQVEGISSNYLDASNSLISEGRALTALDAEHRLKNCVVGPAVVENLFMNLSPIGKELLIGGDRFTVIGVMEKRKGSFFGQNEDDSKIYIPVETMNSMSPSDDWYFLLIRAKSGELDKALEQTEVALRLARGLKPSDENDFDLSTADRFKEQFDSITATIGVVTIAISSVGLMVGGIGVMNIMLVSVKERTREIGVRKAIGARNRDITIQFLIEAMTLTGLGGAAGILLAIGIGLLITLIVPTLVFSVPMWAIVSAFSVSVLIGLMFGVWPAMKAARLDPIESLRYE